MRDHLRIVESGSLEEVGGIKIAGNTGHDAQFFLRSIPVSVHSLWCPRPGSIILATRKFDDLYFALIISSFTSTFIIMYPYSRIHWMR